MKTILYFLMGGIAFLYIIGSISGRSDTTKTEDPKNEIEKHLSELDGSCPKFKRYIKDNLKNPSSFEHVETRYVDNSDGTAIIIMKYRGTNSFNAIITSYAKCTLNIYTGEFSNVIIE
jgi:hypothetical protein